MMEKIEENEIEESTELKKLERTLENMKLITPADVAEKFGCSVRAARTLFQETGFPTIFVGNKYYCVESMFVKWCEERKN